MTQKAATKEERTPAEATATLTIRYIGDPILRQKAKNVKKVTPEIRELIEAMYEAMYASDGVGLAAPQIGESIRLITYDDEGEPRALINPKIVKAEGEEAGTEGCLSVPRINGEVVRAQVVKVRGLDAAGKQTRIKAEGFQARVFQHEIDHLDGILFIDKAPSETLFYVDEFEPEEEDGEPKVKL